MTAKEKFMTYVTHSYTTKQFETDEQALFYIKAEMDNQGLSYLPVYNHTDEYGVRVIVFQYYTLYMEAFVLHQEFDIRRP